MRCRAATIGAVAEPGCARKSLDPDYPGRRKPPRICRTALTRAAAAPVHKRVGSVQHDPPPNRPRICAQRCKPSGSNRSSRANGRALRRRRGRPLCARGGQQRTASDSTVPERRCQRRRWRHQVTRPQFFISPGHIPNRIPPNLPSAADAARLARPQLETVEQDSRYPKQRSGEQVRMKLPANTPHSTSHHRCLPVRPDSGAGFILSAHYAL